MNDKKLDVYSASAGSGKTYTLSRKYIYILLKKSLIEKNTASSLHKHILAVTFTNKATTEMKERIVRDLHLLSLGQHQAFCEDLCKEFTQEGENVNPAQIQERSGKLLRDILHDYSNFSVSTIDMFFQKLLRGFLKEIGIQPDFQIELDDTKLIRQATDLLLERIDRSILSDTNALRAYSEDMLTTGKWNLRRKLSDNAKDVLASHYRKNYLHKDENFRTLEEFQSALRKQQAAWKGKLDELGQKSRQILLANSIGKQDFKYGDSGTLFKLLNTLTSQNYDQFDFEKTRMLLGLEASDSSECGSSKASAAYHAYFPQLQTIAREARDLCLLLTESDHFSRNLALMKVFHLIGNHINLLQQEENLRRLGDAQDLIEHILRENSIPFLYEKAGLRYHHLLLDEFQDTSEGQWNCLSPLLEESLASDNACLIVGDVKQSIYRWREGDWRILGQAVHHKFGAQIQWHPLKKNWRSDAKIVEFNNLLFGSFPKTLAQNFGAPSSFEKVFADVAQEVKNPDSGGYVACHFSDNQNYTWENLGPLIADLIARGYKCSDIAVLVRSKKVAKQAAQAILDYTSLYPELRLEIVSQESLTMESAASVQWMLAMLRLASIPDKERNDANHLHHHEAIAALSRIFPEQDPEAWHVKAFSEAKPLLKLVDEIQNKGLLWAMEALTRWLCEISPENKLRDAAFIQSFHNLVNGYCKNGNNSPVEFLEIWDDAQEHYIQTPPGKNAVNIMTIHKSKGLQFPVVIVPTDQFSLKKKNDPKVWTYPQQLRPDAVEKYKAFGLTIPATPLLISWKESLRKGVFEKLYWEESELEWLEMLNLLYVALTRAENELHVFTTLKKLENPKESELTSGIGANLYAHFQLGSMNTCLLEHLPSGALRYTLGEPSVKAQTASESSETPEHIHYQSYPREITLKIHPYAKRHPSEDDISASPRSYGILMHRLLETIELPEDLEKLSTDERFFDIPRSDLVSCIEKLQKALCDPLAASWFSKSWEVYKEAEILLPDSGNGKKSLRPDRVMIRADEIVIVDYKFGDKAMESERKHREQILNYQAQLSAMGQSKTKIKLYLWYIDCDTLLAVT